MWFVNYTPFQIENNYFVVPEEAFTKVMLYLPLSHQQWYTKSWCVSDI